MRQGIFRTLAGLLAIAFAWAIYLRPLGWRDIPAFLGQVVVMVMFAAYAVFGNGAGWAVAPVQLQPDAQIDHEELDDDAHLQDEG